VKVTRLLRTAAWTAAAAAATAIACTAASGVRETVGLSVRDPDLIRPLREVVPEPRPAEPRDAVERAVFDRINADRRAAGLAAVAWDEGAAQAGRRFCAAQVRERTHGHLLMDGIPPYARTAFAGLFGVGSENSASWLTSGKEFQIGMQELALKAHADMMDEVPPEDGHRRTILDPTATHVGVGWAQQTGSFRMAEEFMTRRLAEMTLTRVAEAPATILVEGRILPPYAFEFVTLANEPSPGPLSRDEADARTSYRYPDPQIAYVAEGRKALHVVGADTQDRVAVRGATFAFRFTPARPGLWTILVYTSEGRQEPRPGGSAVIWMEPSKAR
jgi:uncharacterized protein YkwD